MLYYNYKYLINPIIIKQIPKIKFKDIADKVKFL